mmetsp:Transcript_24387/g.68391  ORF Transcript_24387/g.68391 Transcript_24387/m.68391 type:complete len:145 (-) Transcript_24387:101-535(-)
MKYAAESVLRLELVLCPLSDTLRETQERSRLMYGALGEALQASIASMGGSPRTEMAYTAGSSFMASSICQRATHDFWFSTIPKKPSKELEVQSATAFLSSFSPKNGQLSHPSSRNCPAVFTSEHIMQDRKSLSSVGIIELILCV